MSGGKEVKVPESKGLSGRVFIQMCGAIAHTENIALNDHKVKFSIQSLINSVIPR